METPILGTQQIIEYLSRYIYRTAITNSRIEKITDQTVTINYKKYAENDKIDMILKKEKSIKIKNANNCYRGLSQT